jgi:hypothetical protein
MMHEDLEDNRHDDGEPKENKYNQEKDPYGNNTPDLSPCDNFPLLFRRLL